MSRIISLHYADVPSYVQSKKERIEFLDLAKGFTVLFIPSIHVVMLYSSIDVHRTWLGVVLGFIAEWPGAQLLMFIMGMSFSMSKKSTGVQLKRALMIFCAGYLLNVFKFLILRWCGWMPVTFAHDLKFFHNYSINTNLFLIGDILQFAGIALALMAVLKGCKYYAAITVLLAYLVILFSPIAWDLHHSNLFVDRLLHLIGGNIDDVFFPLFPWLVYPLVGLAIGNYLQLPFASFKAIFFSGMFLLASGFAMQFIPFHFPKTFFWRTYPDMTIAHLGFVMVWISMWFWISRIKLKRRSKSILLVVSPVKSVLNFCGRFITVIYVIQWIVIFWMLPLIGYKVLDVGESLIVISLINVVVFGIVCFIVRKKINST